MLLDLGLLFFVLLGSKLVLGAIAVYMLLPNDERCSICDAETLPIQPARGSARLLRSLRLVRRWCMECRRESLTRRATVLHASRRPPLPVPEPRLR